MTMTVAMMTAVIIMVTAICTALSIPQSLHMGSKMIVCRTVFFLKAKPAYNTN